jgi:hypothetical protein
MSENRSAAFLLRLFPAEWRSRYEDEFRELLGQTGISAGVAFDVLVCAVDARLHPSTNMRMPLMIERLRHHELVIFVCWVIVAVAGSGFAKLTEGPPLNPLFLDSIMPGDTIVPRLAYDAVFIGALVSIVGLLIAGVPIAVAIAIDAFRRRRWSQLFLLATPAVALLAWFVVTVAVIGISFSLTDDVPKALMLGVWLGAGLLAVAVSCIALGVAARNSTIDASMYRRAVNPARLAVTGMVVVTSALIAWGLALFVGNPYDFFSFSGLLATSTALSWGLLAIAAAAATLFALRAAAQLPAETAKGASSTPSRHRF